MRAVLYTDDMEPITVLELEPETPKDGATGVMIDGWVTLEHLRALVVLMTPSEPNADEVPDCITTQIPASTKTPDSTSQGTNPTLSR